MHGTASPADGASAPSDRPCPPLLASIFAGWVVASGQPIAVHDVRTDPRFTLDVAKSTGYVPRSILAAPVSTSGEAIGVMEVLDRTESAGRDDMGLLSLLTRQAGLALQLAESPADDGMRADPATITAALDRLPPDERQAAGALLGAFIDYVRRRGGSAGVV